MLLSQFSGFMQLQTQGREITLDGLHPGSTWPPGGRLQLSREGSKIFTQTIKFLWHVSENSIMLPSKKNFRKLHVKIHSPKYAWNVLNNDSSTDTMYICKTHNLRMGTFSQ